VPTVKHTHTDSSVTITVYQLSYPDNKVQFQSSNILTEWRSHSSR